MKKKGNLLSTICPVAVIVAATFIGFKLSAGKIENLQGYLFNLSNAYPIESTSTTSNASTPSNASTSSNASTPANIYYSTNNINLVKFSFDNSKTYEAGDKVQLAINTTGDTIQSAVLYYKDGKNKAYSANINSVNDNPYIVLPYDLINSIYEAYYITFTAINSQGYSYNQGFEIKNIGYYDNIINVSSQNDDDSLILYNVDLQNYSKIGEFVSVGYKTNVPINKMKLVLRDNYTNERTVYIRNLAKDPDFIVPSNFDISGYSIYSATISTDNVTKTYSIDGKNETIPIALNSYIEISEGVKDTYIYNNEDINEDIIARIKNAKDGIKITINADGNPIINKNIFAAIKNTNKKLTIIYNEHEIKIAGKNIKTPKNIDVSINFTKIDDTIPIYNYVKNGAIAIFSNNGKLPGIVTISLATNATVNTEIGYGSINIYSYNKGTSKFRLIDSNVKLKDGKYIFKSDELSNFILTNKPISNDLIEKTDIVNFQKSDKFYIIVIGAAALFGIIILILVIILNKKNKKIKNLESKTEEITINNENKNEE